MGLTLGDDSLRGLHLAWKGTPRPCGKFWNGWTAKCRRASSTQESRFSRLSTTGSGWLTNESALPYVLLHEEAYEIASVEDRWYEPDAGYFKVRTTNGKTYLLRYEQQGDVWTQGWQLTPKTKAPESFEAGTTRTKVRRLTGPGSGQSVLTPNGVTADNRGPRWVTAPPTTTAILLVFPQPLLPTPV